MGVSYQPLDVISPGTTSECLLELPFEAYTDAPSSTDLSNRATTAEGEVKGSSTVRVQAIPRAEVGPRIGKWPRSLAGFIRSRFTTREADRDDALPLLSEDRLQHRKKRSCRSCVERWLVRGLLGFFVML
jgi:hypothetical protein